MNPVKLNERGRRIGDSHPRSKLSDHEVDLIRELWEGVLEPDGSITRLGVRRIARKFEISKAQVQRIVSYRQRAETISKIE